VDFQSHIYANKRTANPEIVTHELEMTYDATITKIKREDTLFDHSRH
jgi:hypothetical protein